VRVPALVDSDAEPAEDDLTSRLSLNLDNTFLQLYDTHTIHSLHTLGHFTFKYLLKSKNEVISLRLSLSLKYLLRPKFGLSEKSQQFAESKSTYLDHSSAELTWLKSVRFAWKR